MLKDCFWYNNVSMEQNDFEQLVSEAISALPPIAKTAMKNVAFVVEPEIREAKAQEIHIKRGELLLGLYQGVSKINRGSGYFGVLPDKITIFQQPIEMLARNDSCKLKEIVFDVVRHEVGHHLGFNEAGIRAYEAEHRKKKLS
jgi:predicted Zn-dependent protease with MMP-like domain